VAGLLAQRCRRYVRGSGKPAYAKLAHVAERHQRTVGLGEYTVAGTVVPINELGVYSDLLSALAPTAAQKRTLREVREVPQAEVIVPYSISSSASNWRELGTSIPSALAVCRLMTNSNLVDCKIGRSAGLAPLRI
jgi:hypothetical protein